MANAYDDPTTELDTPQLPKRPALELPQQPKSKPGLQSGGATRWFMALGVVGLMGTAGFYTWPHVSDLGGADSRNDWLTEPVVKQRLVLTVSEDGNIESAKNVDVKCEVLGGSTILWIVEDGKQVVKDEVIVRLDESAIDTQLSTQQIAAEKAEAVKIQAEQDYEAARISVEEYEKGTFVMEQQTMEANVKIALENLRASENLLNHTEVMFRKGFVTKQQLEADKFGVQQADLQLKSSQTALRVLQDFTKRKMLTELKAVRDAAAARMRSELAAWQLEVKNLKKLEAQKEKCVILAPQDGMVIHANEQSRRSSNNVTIEEGAAVREQQTIIKLPDLTRMQVKAKIHETKVEQLRVGMPANVKVQDRFYTGKVVSIANQPEPGSWFSSSVKEYAAVVAIEGETQRLKPGMTAEVEIFVADIPEALVVDVTSVVEKGTNKFFVWVVTPDGPEKRPVVVGRTNESVIEIKDGLVEDEVVLLNPRAVIEEAREEEGAGEKQGKDIPDGIPSGPAAGKAKPNKPAQTKSSGPKFSEMDKDGDGKLSKSEAPERMQQYFDVMDSDKDGSINLSEWSAAQKRRKQAQAKGQGGGRPGNGASNP